jgi:acyl-coenzyme A synthetase/AMP-(fatty) acid ligase
MAIEEASMEAHMAESKFDELLACPLDPIELIERHARKTPEVVALRHPSGSYTYQELISVIDRIAGEFHKAGLRQGNTVAIQMDDYFLALLSALALSRLGCPCIFKVVPGQLGDLEVKALITYGGSNFTGIQQIEIKGTWLSSARGVSSPPEFKKGFTSANSPAIYTHSSGSTGRPKIISSTWARLHKAVVDSLRHPHHKPWLSPCLVSLGFSSLWGFRQMLTILWTGGTLVLGNCSTATARNLAALNVRHIAASIAQLFSWSKIARKDPSFFRSVEAVTTGGARLSPSLAETVRQNICQEIYINFGSSETGLIAAGSADIQDKLPDAVGVALDTAAIEIVDADGRLLPRGETGLVRVQTGAMTESEKSAGFQQGWFYTGDSGAFHEDGTLCIFGRSDGVVNIDGVKLRLEDAEEALGECPGVADVALFVIKDDSGRSRVHCAYVPDRDFDNDLFVKYWKKLPILNSVIELEKIPRGGNEKILRRELASIGADKISQI